MTRPVAKFSFPVLQYTACQAKFSFADYNPSTPHVKAFEESDSFAQVVSGQNTTLHFYPKSGLPGYNCMRCPGQAPKHIDGDCYYGVPTQSQMLSPKSIILRTSTTYTDAEPQTDNAYTHHVRRSQAPNPSHCMLFYREARLFYPEP